MTQPDQAKRPSPATGWSIDRRTVLKVSGGSIAATVLGGAYALDAVAQETDASAGYLFFTRPQFATVEAVAEQYWPTTDASPGGRDAGVAIYIDRALAGVYQEYQDLYHAGLGWLDTAANQQGGANFADLEAAQQLELLTAVFDETLELAVTGGGATPAAVAGTPEAAAATPVASPVAVDVDEGGASTATGLPSVAGLEKPQADSLLTFLNVVRVHTMEGLFSDPAHGGNRNFAGWKAVGYPGPYVYYGEDEQQSMEPLDQPLQSIADL